LLLAVAPRFIGSQMDWTQLILISTSIAVVAFLYSSVGHAGASGYIAVLTLFGFAGEFFKPVALVLNIMVASIGAFQFWRAGHFSWSLFWPFAVLSAPLAFFGGSQVLHDSIFKPLVGAVLLFSAARLFFRKGDPVEVTPPDKRLALGVGAGIGYLAGLTSTGGGIFLTPLLLFRRWARARTAAAVSAMFILVNSSSGLAGHFYSGKSVPEFAWGIAAAAVCGGTLGSQMGSRRFPVRAITVLLATVLIIAGLKLMFGGRA
jgi:uncharacterized protein